MKLRKTRNKVDLFDVLSKYNGEYVLLQSSEIRSNFSGRYSLLALYPNDSIKNIEELDKLKSTSDKFDNSYFGYISYEAFAQFEDVKLGEDLIIESNEISLKKYAIIFVNDNLDESCNIYATDEYEQDINNLIIETQNSRIGDAENKYTVSKSVGGEDVWVRHDNDNEERAKFDVRVKNIESNFTKDEYIRQVNYIKKRIREGDLYQVNLTRKFYGELAYSPDIKALFSELCGVSPTPYSALIADGNKFILSSSPERFLSIDNNRNIITTPIKGSSARYMDSSKDNLSRKRLVESEKDKAENLMITDLMRNDLSRICKAGSVRVDGLFNVTSHAKIHHMSSNISGKLAQGTAIKDVLAATFPPGSMTGAPKVKAMEMITDLEKYKRGIYSGAIGWFGGDGSADLSVVIRTLIIEGNKFEFQVGGAITHYSDAMDEWEETIIKARPILEILGISEIKLRNL